MNKISMGIKSVAALALVAAVTAATGATKPTVDLAAVAKARSEVQARMALGSTKIGATGVRPAGSQPAEFSFNPDRSYPASCLDAPLGRLLGAWNNDPNFLQANIELIGDQVSSDPNERTYSEVDTVTLFRVVCAGGLSATLLEIDRPSGSSTTLYPTFPEVTVAQGSNNYVIRVANDPNTFDSVVYALTPVFNSTIFVLENYSCIPAAGYINYDDAFTLTVNNLMSSNNLTNYPLGAYNPADYADASKALPISGHMSTNWANLNESGDGIVMQIYDDGDAATRTLAFAWFTYDDNHLPFWLFGQGTFNIGARSATVQTAYYVGGTFAPPSAMGAIPPTIWGTTTFSFPDCTHMTVQYNGNAAAVNGPTGSGTRFFGRSGYVNGLICI